MPNIFHCWNVGFPLSTQSTRTGIANMLDRLLNFARRRPIRFGLSLFGLVFVFYAFNIVRYMGAALSGPEQSQGSLVKGHLEALGLKAQAGAIWVQAGYGGGCSLWTLEPDRKECYRFFVDEPFINSGAIAPTIDALLHPCETAIAKTDLQLHRDLKCGIQTHAMPTKKIEFVVRKQKTVLYVLTLTF